MDVRFLYSFLLALLLSLIFIPFLIRNSARLGLLDDPEGNMRKLHSFAIPRSGGLGIVLAAALSVLVVLPANESLFSFVLACLVIIGFGLLDDLVELRPLQKLGGQAIGVIIAMSGGMVMTNLPFLADSPMWFAHLVTFFFVLGVINGVNFSDGMDGLAAGITLMALVLIFVLAMESSNAGIAQISLAVAAALLGFLRFNTHPAKIFMGDAGSQFLGFSLAWLSINLSQSGSGSINLLIPLLILGIPVMDILQVVPVRIKKGLPLPGPDREHLHHQIAKLGFYQFEVVSIIYVMQAVLLVSAYMLRYGSDQAVLAFYFVYSGLVLGAIYLANVFNWKIRIEAEDDGFKRRNQFFRRMGRLHPYTGKFFGAIASLFLFVAAILSDALPTSVVYVALGLALTLVLIMLFLRGRWPLVVGRLASYFATVLLMWGMTQSVTSEFINMIADGLLAAVAILLIFSVRITRRQYFGLTTVDLLVLIFFVTLTPLVMTEFGENLIVVRTAFRIVLMLYVCEFVLARGEKAWKRLTYMSIFSLFALALHL
jgi:UDP-GlcNAc:undecaprenyl-phosphate/decaprenyl-phosphate GlcNAc-1-phosphate transferase